MSKRTKAMAEILGQCSSEEKREVISYLRRQVPLHPLESEWNTSAEAILTAIARSNDLTQRGIRGILAEATFDEIVVPLVQQAGWQPERISGDQTFDFCLRREGRTARIQVKLQRKETGKPKLYGKKARSILVGYDSADPLYVVEVQKTRSGKKKGKKTRPYRFGDFDVLAVNMHPATGNWQKFMYTVGEWLIPRSAAPDQVEIFQPVSLNCDECWTDNIMECLDWLSEGRKRTIYR